MRLLSLFVLLILSFSSFSEEMDCKKTEIPSEIQVEIDYYVSLGDSASGEELSDALWRLGVQRHEFASQLWGELSNQQKISVYRNKIDSFLNSGESANLSTSQIDFIENSKNIMRRAFEENWQGNEDEYLYFSMQVVQVLGLKIAGDIYGARALWPRTPTTIDAP